VPKVGKLKIADKHAIKTALGLQPGTKNERRLPHVALKNAAEYLPQLQTNSLQLGVIFFDSQYT